MTCFPKILLQEQGNYFLSVFFLILNVETKENLLFEDLGAWIHIGVCDYNSYAQNLITSICHFSSVSASQGSNKSRFKTPSIHKIL